MGRGNRRGRRTKRRLKRAKLKPMSAYQRTRGRDWWTRLVARETWYRKHFTISTFSYGNRHKKGEKAK